MAIASKKFWKFELSLAGLLQALWVTLMTGSAFGTLLGFCGSIWPFELASHFRLQFGALLLAMGFVEWIRKKVRLALGLFAMASINAILIWPHLQIEHPRHRPEHVFRILLVNVQTDNREYAKVLELIAERRPDLIVLEEVNSVWLEQLQSIHAHYPDSITYPRDDNFGIALFSRHELIEPEPIEIGDAEVPALKARVALGGKETVVLATHPLPPGSPVTFRQRNQHLVALANEIRNLDRPVVLAGDLNVTPWSSAFRALLRNSGLSLPPLGLDSTWPAHWLPLRIPIDHILLSREFVGVRRTIGPRIGSDHLPVELEFGWEVRPPRP
ncbi:MAG: endonuclease/exonuclease/phosphatase family protein [Verrucomicrobiota bacterium]